MKFYPDRRKNAFQRGECWVPMRGESTVKRLPVHAGSHRHFSDFVSLGDIAEGQQEHVLRFFSRCIEIGSNVLWILQAFMEPGFVRL